MIGDRTAGDEVTYPDIDLELKSGPGGVRGFYRKDGTPIRAQPAIETFLSRVGIVLWVGSYRAKDRLIRGDNLISLSAAGLLINTQFMYLLPRLHRLHQVPPLRMLDTAKKRGVTRLY